MRRFMKRFRLIWIDGHTQIVRGKNFDDACERAGIDHDCRRSIDDEEVLPPTKTEKTVGYRSLVAGIKAKFADILAFIKKNAKNEDGKANKKFLAKLRYLREKLTEFAELTEAIVTDPDTSLEFKMAMITVSLHMKGIADTVRYVTDAVIRQLKSDREKQSAKQ